MKIKIITMDLVTRFKNSSIKNKMTVMILITTVILTLLESLLTRIFPNVDVTLWMSTIGLYLFILLYISQIIFIVSSMFDLYLFSLIKLEQDKQGKYDVIKNDSLIKVSKKRVEILETFVSVEDTVRDFMIYEEVKYLILNIFMFFISTLFLIFLLYS